MSATSTKEAEDFLAVEVKKIIQSYSFCQVPRRLFLDVQEVNESYRSLGRKTTYGQEKNHSIVGAC